MQRVRRLRSSNAMRLATFFSSIGDIPSEREYLYLQNTPLRLTQIKKLFGSYKHMLQEVSLILNKESAKAATPSEDIGALLREAATKAATADMD